jgi:osmotically-inducible protein OsmY
MRTTRSTPLVVVAAGGALLGWLGGLLLDGRQGRRRRKLIADKAGAFFRGRTRAVRRLGRGAVAKGYGLTMRSIHRREQPKPQPDDVTLTHKVESEVFRAEDVPKGQINVNAENGVVFLRGELARPELIERLVEETRNVQGVRDVRNLLHVPGGTT